MGGYPHTYTCFLFANKTMSSSIFIPALLGRMERTSQFSSDYGNAVAHCNYHCYHKLLGLINYIQIMRYFPVVSLENTCDVTIKLISWRSNKTPGWRFLWGWESNFLNRFTLLIIMTLCWVCWHMPVNPAPRRLRQGNLESGQHIGFQASLSYIVRHCLKRKQR